MSELDDMTPIERLKWRFEEIIAEAVSDTAMRYASSKEIKTEYFAKINEAIKAFEDEEAKPPSLEELRERGRKRFAARALKRLEKEEEA